MNKTLKNKWLKALRSGEYAQGVGRLRTNKDEFCCLGVLCDISGKGVWEDQTFIPKVSQKAVNAAGLRDDSQLRFESDLFQLETRAFRVDSHRCNCEFCDVSEADTVVNTTVLADMFGLTEVQNAKLAEMNDRGDSFVEIADWIKENV